MVSKTSSLIFATTKLDTLNDNEDEKRLHEIYKELDDIKAKGGKLDFKGYKKEIKKIKKPYKKLKKAIKTLNERQKHRYLLDIDRHDDKMPPIICKKIRQ